MSEVCQAVARRDYENFFFVRCKANVALLTPYRTDGRAYATVLRLSVVVCDVMYCG